MFKYMGLIAFLILLAGVSNAWAEVQYSIVDLGLVGEFGYPRVVNDSGKVLLGYSALTEKGFLWENGGITELDRFYLTMNNAGQMVSFDSFRDSNGEVSTVPGPAGKTFVFDMNDAGQFAGYQYLTFNSNSATVWNGVAGSSMILGEMVEAGSTHSMAYAINNKGQVVGNYADPVTAMSKAFVWDTEAETAIPLGEGIVLATDINDRGQILCRHEDGDTTYRCLWDQGVVTNLGDWWANSINNSGEVVGNVILDDSVPSTPVYDALLWKEGVKYSLDTLLLNGSGWDLVTAYNNNNAGQIVGVGILNGEEHAYLLTPIPEPATLSLFLLGGMAVRRRKIRERR